MSSTRVVLCDDEEMVLEALTTAMEALGVIVVGATADPVAAVALVRLFQPDVCVLDAHFPEGSGPEPAARMGTMCGCCSCAATSISFLNRAALTSLANSGGSTLITIWRFSDRSVATNSRLIPPPPSSRSST